MLNAIISHEKCYFKLTQGCAHFAEILSELTKTWSSGATECRV